MDDLLDDFLSECFEGMATLDVELVALERNPGEQARVSTIFRVVHTIKGTCGFLDLPRLEGVAHAAENVLGLLRSGELQATPAVTGVLLAAVDRMRRILEGIAAAKAEPTGDDAELIASLTAASQPAPAAVAATAAGEPPAEESRKASAPVEAVHGAAEAAATQTLRVRIELLEQLMALVGELVLTRNQLLQLVRSSDDGTLKAPLQRLSHITSELQDGVMRTRMQPVGSIWNSLPRVVRDLGVELGKEIDIRLEGAETELDRQVLELIKDPLTHMIRNSADHGLEPPAERRRRGKPERGTIRLEAFHESGHIVIRVGDDGRGLDVARIRAKILANRLASEQELAAMGTAQLLQYIFRPGFSTAEAVSSVSGRGVGMDVVRSNIEQIGGSITLASEEGRGTTFAIQIPLTLAIVSVLIVGAGGQRFAIPQLGVVELVRAGGGAGHRVDIVDGTPILRLRDRLLPLLSLAGLMQLPAAPLREDRPVYVVVLRVGTTSLGLLVDQVFDTEEIVVKPLAPILRHVRMFSGNTILGDGGVVMILDLNTVAGSLSGLVPSQQNAKAAAAPLAAESTTLLLFRAGSGTPRAVPLALVTRLEEIGAEDVEWSSGRTVMQYRGALMPLVDVQMAPVELKAGRKSVLVFTDSGRNMGLLVDEIIDITEAGVSLDLVASGPGCLGSAIICGRSTELLDVAFFVTSIFGGWFSDDETEPFGRERKERGRILLVDDSAFFRSLLLPILEAGGYRVVAAAGPEHALRLRLQGEMFDTIISDIEMPGMDGFSFAAACRVEGPWREVPIIALTSHTTPQDIARGREAGFTGYVGKLDRKSLLEALGQAHQHDGSPA